MDSTVNLRITNVTNIYIYIRNIIVIEAKLNSLEQNTTETKQQCGELQSSIGERPGQNTHLEHLKELLITLIFWAAEQYLVEQSKDGYTYGWYTASVRK
jgi:hypothetical protein